MGLSSGNYIRYWSFDTLDNVTLMQRQRQSNFGSLVFGQVEMHVGVCNRASQSTNLNEKYPFLILIYIEKLYSFIS